MKLLVFLLPVLLLIACGNAQTVEPQPPQPQLPSGYLYKVEPGIPGKSVYVCGERPFDATGKLVGPGNLDLQTKQAFENIKTALKTVNMTMADVTQVTYSVKTDKAAGPPLKVDASKMQQVSNVAASYLVVPPQITESKAVGKIIRDDVLIEIEVIAVK